MIRTKKELKFYIRADEIMNEQVFPQSWIKRLLLPCAIQRFMRCMRKLEYYYYRKELSKWHLLPWLYYRVKYHRLSEKLGFDIPINTLGYGCRIAHKCGIIISGATKIGNYCCLYRASFADGHPKRIGNHVFIGTNVVVAKETAIADGCTISAMSFVNSSILKPNQLWGGVIAKYIKECRPWTEEQPYRDEYERCEMLKKELGLTDI